MKYSKAVSASLRLPSAKSSTTNLFRSISSTAASSSTTTPSYTAPVAPGVLPVYDVALAYLLADQQAKLTQLRELKLSEEVSREELEEVEISAFVNDPEIRWKAKNNQGDLSLPVYRHLAERAFRKEGPLALLLQRITQMSLIPDLLPSIHPIVDLKIKLSGSEREIVPGEFVLPLETKEVVTIEAQVFHAEERLYTLLMIDPDVPDELNHTFTTYAHWIIPNIPLSSTQSTISPSTLSSALLSYIPPHPQQGTPYHRYTFLLFAQPSSSSPSTTAEPITLNLDHDSDVVPTRQGLNIRDFATRNNLTCQGITFFRQVWDREVRIIYKELLPGVEEPRFGAVSRAIKYVDEDGLKPQKYRLE